MSRGRTVRAGAEASAGPRNGRLYIRVLIISAAIVASGASTAAGVSASRSREAPFRTESVASTRAELRAILSAESAPADQPTITNLLASFYAERDFRPVWSGSVEAARMAGEVRAAFMKADDEGLRSEDYAGTTSQWDSAPPPGREAAEYDLSLTADLLRYAVHLRTGRVRPSDAYKDVGLPTSDFDPVVALGQALQRHSLNAFLADLRPVHPEYRRLAEALARYRAIAADGGWPSIPGGALALEGKDPRLYLLKVRLALEDKTLASTPDPSASDLLDAVKRFQERHGLAADGRVGPGTLTALNVPASVRVEQIAANMERWRWLPRTFERRYVRVNVPNQSLEFVRDGEVILSSKVIVGRKNSPTPLLRTTVYWVVANPPWDIPDDIAANQFLPQLRKNPNYLAAQNMVLVNGPPDDPQGRKIDWNKVPSGHFPYHVVQIPGPNSALGSLMLDSPNDFDVYLHDTPGKNFFAQDDREISNGCVRVQQIFPLASLALTNDTEAGAEQLKNAIASGQTQEITLDDPLPLYMVYWTAAVNEDGAVEFHTDRYNRDKPLIAALGGSAETAQKEEARAASAN